MSSGRPANPDRQIAIGLGERTYIGSTHARCGTSGRYVSGGGCVHCARVVATEQREARKYLKQQKLALDIPPEMALEVEDDAAARAQKAIDDLM